MPKESKRNIALTGFMAVGKSAVGRDLAKKLRRRFVDLDRLIEKAEGKKVAEIFAEKGEGYFRQLEKQVLAQVLQKDGQVIATGGGTIMNDENLALVKTSAWLISLTAPLETVLARVGDGATRPLLKGRPREHIVELMAQRAERYAQAHVAIDTSGCTIAQVAEKIVEFLNTENVRHENPNC